MGPGTGTLATRLAEKAAEAARTRTRPGPIAQPSDLTPRLTPGSKAPARSRPTAAPQPIPAALVDAWARLQPAERDAVLGLALSLVRAQQLVRAVRAVLVAVVRRSCIGAAALDAKGNP